MLHEHEFSSTDFFFPKISKKKDASKIKKKTFWKVRWTPTRYINDAGTKMMSQIPRSATSYEKLIKKDVTMFSSGNITHFFYWNLHPRETPMLKKKI